MENVPVWLEPFVQPETLVALGKSIFAAVATLVIGWMVAGRVARITLAALQRSKVDVALARFLGNIARYVVLVATLVATAEAVGIHTTSVLAILASAGLAVGLALQGSLSNFASGVMILLFHPFRLDDWVTVCGLTGRVIDIGLFSTVLMRTDGTKIVVPNSAITGGVIENHTELDKRRATVDVGVEYGCDLDEARAALGRACERVDGVLPNDDGGKAYTVYFASFGGSSLDFQIHVWSTAADFLDVQERVRVEVYKELAASGIGIPFPQLDLHVDPAVIARAR